MDKLVKVIGLGSSIVLLDLLPVGWDSTTFFALPLIMDTGHAPFETVTAKSKKRISKTNNKPIGDIGADFFSKHRFQAYLTFAILWLVLFVFPLCLFHLVNATVVTQISERVVILYLSYCFISLSLISALHHIIKSIVYVKINKNVDIDKLRNPSRTYTEQF